MWRTHIHTSESHNAIEVSHVACKDEFQRNPRSHSWRFFFLIFYNNNNNNGDVFWPIDVFIRYLFHRRHCPPRQRPGVWNRAARCTQVSISPEVQTSQSSEIKRLIDTAASSFRTNLRPKSRPYWTPWSVWCLVLLCLACVYACIINTSYQKLPFGSGDYPDTC